MAGIAQSFNNITYTKENLDDGKIKLSIEVDNDRFVVAKDKVYERLAPSVTIQGFRPGKAPKNLIEANLGAKLFEETLGVLVPEVTLEVLKREELTPIDQIAYQVEKVAEGAGVKFNALFTPFPKFKLPNISKISVKKEKTDVTDEDVTKVIDQMYKDRKDSSADSTGSSRAGSEQDKKLEKRDKWAQSLEMNVKTIAELETKVKEELKKQKEILEQNKYLDAIIKEIIKKSKFDVPKAFIDQEVAAREQQYKARIERLGMKVEDFLKNQKTSMEKLEKGWREEAEEKVKAEIILLQVAKEYKVEVSEDEVNKQISAIKDENLKKQYETPQAKNYLRTMILRQKVVQKIVDLVERKK